MSESVYTAFGLNLQSDLPLPELGPAEAKPDVVIRLGEVGLAPDEEGPIECERADAHEFVLTWGKVGSLLVRDGREMVIDPVRGVDEAALRLLVLGAGMAMVLHQRGLTVLHASAVAISGRAVAFLADKGWGKSSTAAALVERGHAMVTDDILAIDSPMEGQPLALFSYPQIKLWPESLSALGYQPEALPRIRPDVDKRLYPLERMLGSRCPLECIYFLGNGSSLEITSIPPQVAFVEIMRNLYVPGFGPTVFGILDQAAIMRQCSQLSRNVATRLVHRPNDLGRLRDIARLIECDLEQSHARDLEGALTPTACL